MIRKIKGVILHLLGFLGLLLPVFRGWERLRSLGAEKVTVRVDGLPLPSPTLMVRVAGTADIAWFLEGGKLGADAVRGAVERAGTPMDSLKSIFDFGCGCGRVLRHWQHLDARVYGSDLSEPAIEWCRENLAFATVGVNALEPPLNYPAESFDLIYAFSVLTHLAVDTQLAWRDELGRVLRPGGLLLLSLHGDAYLEKLDPDERRAYANGECVVRWAGVAGSNLCSAFHPSAFVRNHLALGWEFIEHVPRGARGNPEQDLILLRKSGSSSAV